MRHVFFTGTKIRVFRQIPIEALEQRRLLATVAPQIGQNFDGINSTQTGFIPPDTHGAVGNNHVVAIANGRYTLYDRFGNQQATSTLNTFWTNAGTAAVGSAYDPRAEYDPGVDRFYVCSLDNGQSDNGFLFAISNTDDPNDGWTGFRIDSDAGTGNRWADFPSMGFDNDGVYITANMIDIAGGAALSTEVNLLVLPKVDLLLNTPSISRRTLIEDVIGTTGRWAVPVTYIDASEAISSYPPSLISADGDSFDFSEMGGTIFSPTVNAAPDVAVQSFNEFNSARQPDGTADLDAKGWKMRSHIYEQNGSFWAVQSIEGNSSNGAIRFIRIDTGYNIVQGTLLENSSADYLYPSIAVNDDEDVVIGFTFTGPDAGEFPSAKAFTGTTSGNTTTFASTLTLATGTASYHQNDSNGFNRWGDYSQTVIDPKHPSAFWTFQEYSTGTTNWNIRIAKVSPNGVLPGDLPLTKTSAAGFVVPHGPTGASDDALSFDANINTSGDIDAYYFGGDAVIGSNYTITVGDFASNTADPAFVVYDATTGDMVAFDEDSGADDDATVSFTGTNNKRYVLALADENGGTGNYSVLVDYGNTTQGVNLVLDANGHVAANTTLGTVDPDFYRFTTPSDATGTGTVSLDAITATLDSAVWVFDASGNVLGSAFSAGAGLTDTINLTGLFPSTEYYITVLSTEFATSGDATLTIDVDYIPSALGLTFVGAVSGQLLPSAATGIAIDTYFGNANIDFATDIDSYYVAQGSVASGSFTIVADDTGGSGVDAVAAVYRADTGALVAWDDDSGVGNAASITFTPALNTAYIVAVSAQSGTGDVVLTWQRSVPTTTVIPLVGGMGSVSGIIGGNTVQYFQFTTPAFVTGAGNATLVADNATFDGTFLITDAVGNEIATARTNNPGGTDAAVFAGLLANTTYYGSITSYNYATSGPATMNIGVGIPVPPAPGGLDLVAASDSGVSPTDNITADDTPTMAGTAAANSTVHLYAGAVEVGTAVANGAGNWSITASALADATYPFTAKADFGGALSPASGTLNVTIDKTSPTIGVSAFHYESVFSLTVPFSEDVGASLVPGDFAIVNLAGPTVVPNASKALSYAGNVETITFPTLTNTVLPDGNYTLAIAAADVRDPAGNQLPAPHLLSFFFLQGDANRDRAVNTLDFNLLAANFGGTSKIFSQGNFNYDALAEVNSLDFNILITQYGKKLPAPAAPLAAATAQVTGMFGESAFSTDEAEADPIIT